MKMHVYLELLFEIYKENWKFNATMYQDKEIKKCINLELHFEICTTNRKLVSKTKNQIDQKYCVILELIFEIYTINKKCAAITTKQAQRNICVYLEFLFEIYPRSRKIRDNQETRQIQNLCISRTEIRDIQRNQNVKANARKQIDSKNGVNLELMFEIYTKHEKSTAIATNRKNEKLRISRIAVRELHQIQK